MYDLISELYSIGSKNAANMFESFQYDIMKSAASI
jgi:hypothetical protein